MGIEGIHCSLFRFYNGIQNKPPRGLNLWANVPPIPGRRQNFFLAWRKPETELNCWTSSDWVLILLEWEQERMRCWESLWWFSRTVGQSAVFSGILQDTIGKWTQQCVISSGFPKFPKAFSSKWWFGKVKIGRFAKSVLDENDVN